jgi:predicted ATPase/class 3 adenylate cyclase
MAGHPPSGTVTFLLTDLEGSTRLWEQDSAAMKAAMVRHDELLEKTIATHQGFVFARMGDGMAAAFGTARDAINAASAIQQALADEPWSTPRPPRARIGLHTDEDVVYDDGYASLPINRCARLMAAAHGGQVLISGTTEALLRDRLPSPMALLDLGEHRLRDLGRPTRVFQLSRDGEREDFPPLRSLDAYPGNIPVQSSSFIGRQLELARVASALGESRVVTITGVGGVGKTRLAIQTAADLLPRYREGAWFVELAALRDPDGVVDAVAAAFGLTNRSGPALEDALIEMLMQKQLLLVLDNCEHLLSSVARLVTRIERKCPGVVVLATSREGISIDGEQLIALPPMQTGQPGGELDRLVHSDAVSLFVERSRHVKADFALTDSNVGIVVEICQRLDGVPLAIELAAARVIALSPAELLRRLDRRFQVLAGGRRGAVERHATLRAAIDWSYELLDAAEQRLLARLAVFSGDFALEAIEQICTGDPVVRDAVIDLVTGLVARSLVVAEDHDLGTRYRLLETIRQYAEERLTDWGETESLRFMHARYYATQAGRAAEHYYGPEQLIWARQVNLERDNIRAALAHAIDVGDSALAVQLVSETASHQIPIPIGEVTWVPVSRVLDLPGVPKEPGYARVLLVAAYQAVTLGEHDIASELCDKAIEADRSRPMAGQRSSIEMEVCALQGMASLSAGDYADAVAAYDRAAERAREDGFVGLAAVCLAHAVNTALLGGAAGRDQVAKAEQALALSRRSGMPAAIVLSLNAFALTVVEDDPRQARALLRESVEIGGIPGAEASSGMQTAGLVAGRLEDWDLTLALNARTMNLFRWNMAPLQTATNLAWIARALAGDRPEEAGVLRGAAYATFRRASPADENTRPSSTGHGGPNANFLLAALRQTGDMVSAVLGDEARRVLRNQGAAMTMDEAVSYALANVDPRLLTGPIRID